MAMATDRSGLTAVPAAAALLLWPALWNAYPIVFADTGTYLSQAIEGHAGWDRPVFYSVFMLPLHATLTVWPVVGAQALLAAWVLWRVSRALVPGIGAAAFVAGMAALSLCTWLPWLVCELMPDVLTPLLVLVLSLLAVVPDRLSAGERFVLVGWAAFMIAAQQSSLPLACVLAIAAELPFPRPSVFDIGRNDTDRNGTGRDGTDRNHISSRRCDLWNFAATYFVSFKFPYIGTVKNHCQDRFKTLESWIGHHPPGRRCLIGAPIMLAIVALGSANLAAFGRFDIAPFGNVFLLARVIYDGPGMAVLRRDCPRQGWLLCPFLDDFPPRSDDFLWQGHSPLEHAGGAKRVSSEAGAILRAALLADPWGEARAALANTLRQITAFASGDGLNPWPEEVSPVIERDFPIREQAAYAAARQQTGVLSVPQPLPLVHRVTGLAGVLACALLLPAALRRRAACAGFIVLVLLTLPVSAAITGALSTPHDRYQARIMWLPPFIAALSFASLRRRAP